MCLIQFNSPCSKHQCELILIESTQLYYIVAHRAPAPLYSYPETDLPSGISS